MTVTPVEIVTVFTIIFLVVCGVIVAIAEGRTLAEPTDGDAPAGVT